MARRTSIQAYEFVQSSGAVGRQQRRIYNELYEHGPMTATECLAAIDQEMKQHIGKGLNWNTRTRFGELRDKGLIEEVGERACKITHRNVILWDVTDNFPQPLPKRTGPRRPSKPQLQRAVEDLTEIKSYLEKVGHAGFSEELIEVYEWLQNKCL